LGITDEESAKRLVEKCNGVTKTPLAAYFNGKIVGFSLIQNLEDGNQTFSTEIKKALDNLGIPKNELMRYSESYLGLRFNSDGQISNSDNSIIRTLCVSKQRLPAGTKGVGKLLFREAIRKTNVEQNKALLLSVIADKPFSWTARQTYRTQGGSYLGYGFDYNDNNKNLMHYFIF